MHFTVSFASPYQENLSYGLGFMPCPVWMRQGSSRGETDLFLTVPDPTRPDYRLGHVAALFATEPGLRESAMAARHAVVIAWTTGHGTEHDLAMLLEDLEKEGFTTDLFRVDSARMVEA
ncbi:MAG: hypothetical protein ACKOT0_03915 [bacterium]